MPKIVFEEVTEGLSVPTFWLAYRELGRRHQLFSKSLEEVVDFFDGLRPKAMRRVARAFGLQMFITPGDRLEIYVGGAPGLPLVSVPIPEKALRPGGHAYRCPCCGRGVDTDFMDRSAVAALAGLYAAEDRVRTQVFEFCMVQPIEVSFPYRGGETWHELDVWRMMAEQVLASKLGLPEIIPPETLQGVARLLSGKYGFDMERWAETRARNIRQGIEPDPQFFGYVRVDGESLS